MYCLEANIELECRLIMKFIDKLNSFLLEYRITYPDIFIHWVIKQAQLNCSVEAIKNISEQEKNEVSFDVSQLEENDLKKLKQFFMISENTFQIGNVLSISEQFLCDFVFPKFQNYAITFSENQNEENRSSQIISSIAEDIDEDFVLVDFDGEIEYKPYEAFPWLNPQHPLYFPSSQPDSSRSFFTRWDAMDKFSVENWYPHLKEFTFDSQFISLDFEDIKYLIGKHSPNYDPTRLENIFDHGLEQFGNQEAFMRMSTRSPKDSVHLFDKAATIMGNDVCYWRETDNKNQQLVSFVASMTKAMKVTSGKKIIETIKESPRVFGDLLSLISNKNPLNSTTEVVLRRWYDMRPDHEFRVFVSRRCREKSIVTAISQYFHFLYFDNIPEDCFNHLDEESKQNHILTFQNYVLKLIDPAVAKFLNFTSDEDYDNSSNCIREYIVDLALIPLDQYHGDVTDDNQIMIWDKTYILMVIELNPFAPSATGSGLFNWETDLDMLWGKAPCEYPIFSYRQKPREDFKNVTLIPPNYEQVIQKAISKKLTNSIPYVDKHDRPEIKEQVNANSPDRFFLPSQGMDTSSREEMSRASEKSLASPI